MASEIEYWRRSGYFFLESKTISINNNVGKKVNKYIKGTIRPLETSIILTRQIRRAIINVTDDIEYLCIKGFEHWDYQIYDKEKKLLVFSEIVKRTWKEKLCDPFAEKIIFENEINKEIYKIEKAIKPLLRKHVLEIFINDKKIVSKTGSLWFSSNIVEGSGLKIYLDFDKLSGSYFEVGSEELRIPAVCFLFYRWFNYWDNINQ